jgi:ankyrin repeat protein
MTAARTCLMIAFCCAFAATPGTSQRQPDSETFLEAIEEQNNNKVVDLVTSKGRSIINVRGYSGATPLNVAMRKRSLQYVSYLLQNGADPNFSDKSGETALLIGARMGNYEGVNALLVAKAAVDGANRQGETPLIVAVQNRHVQVIRRLLEAGASTTRTDNAGLNARDYATRDRRSAEILKLFHTVKKKPVFVAGPIIR